MEDEEVVVNWLKPKPKKDMNLYTETFEDIIKPPTVSPNTREAIRNCMKMDNPLRWRRITSDYRWMERQMKKYKLNPEDARWLL